MDQKTPAESERKIKEDIHGSPEYLPRSAKIQRLESKEKPSLHHGSSAKSIVYHEMQSSQTATTTNVEKTAAEKLILIREQEEKIEQMLIVLESNVKRGQKILQRSFSFQINLYTAMEIQCRLISLVAFKMKMTFACGILIVVF